VGPDPTKPPVERGALRAKGRRRPRSTRQESTFEVTDQLLGRQVSINVGGQVKRVSAIEAIMLHLMQKATSDNARACRLLLKYEEFAKSRTARSTEVRFVDSEYTRAVAKSPSGSGDGQ
jgi:hypothetical protein